MLTSLPVILVISSLAGFLSAAIAQRRGRNPYFWFGVGFLFGLIGLLAIFIAPAPKRVKKEVAMAQIEPKPFIDGPTDRFWYYLDSSHQQQGPMSLDALTQAWRKGVISLKTFVWHEELSDWKELQELIKNRT